jgi:hypothetical protein
MDHERLKDLADRDQLWASLRELRAEIERLATSEWEDSERQRQLSVLLARIVIAELDFQATYERPADE